MCPIKTGRVKAKHLEDVQQEQEEVIFLYSKIAWVRSRSLTSEYLYYGITGGNILVLGYFTIKGHRYQNHSSVYTFKPLF